MIKLFILLYFYTSYDYRAGQKRWNKSTIRNAKKRLKNEKESYNDRLENTYNAVLNSSYSLKKRFIK